MRWKCFILVLLISLLAQHSIGCLRSGNAANNPSAAPASPEASRPVGDVDAAVIGRVLKDLVTNKGDENPVAPRGTLLESIQFSREAVAWQQTVDMVLYEHEPQRWQRLTKSQRAAVHEAAEDLVARTPANQQRFRIDEAPKPITLIEKPATTNGADRGPPEVFNRAIRAWLPGYSADGTIAVVRLSIPWSIHHAEGTYVLRRADGSWVVLLRQFVYYL